MPKEFDKRREAIKESFRKQHPEMSPEEIERRSYAIAVSSWKKQYGRPPIRE